MLQTGLKHRQAFENAAARYRALLTKTRDLSRRQMLEEMIARELAAARQLEIVRPNYEESR